MSVVPTPIKHEEHVHKDKHDLIYYGKCVIGGLIACGLTHSGITPLDLVKCRKQVDSKMYKSIGNGMSVIFHSKGISGLYLGWLPCLYGYSLQGMGKFGFYEVFKDVYAWIVGEKNAQKYRTTGYLLAAAGAEFLADIMLCPFESLKVRMQTSLPEGTFTKKFLKGFSQIKNTEGAFGFYKGITPLWLRQIPYTMVKFSCFENIVRAFYTFVFTKPKNTYSKTTQLTVTFMSGYIAGVFCAIVSHPADTMVSKLNQKKSTAGVMASVKEIYGEIGFMGLWRGLTARIIMIGTLTGLQWWIYDSFKTAVGLQTTGGK